MLYDRMFQFLICSPALGAETLEGQRLGQIAKAIEQLARLCTYVLRDEVK